MANHAVIVAHPRTESFTLSVARAYQKVVEDLGHKVIVRDLYRMNFLPVLREEELPSAKGVWPGNDIATERAALMDTDVFCFVYPVWFCVPPAILIGYVQRMFGMGFGYGPQKGGENQRLLQGRALISFSSSGAPTEWMQADGSLDAIHRIFDNHLAAVCGMRVVEHRHFGRVASTTPAQWINGHLEEVHSTIRRHFTPN